MWFGRFDKPVLVWCITNDQTALGLVSTNGWVVRQTGSKPISVWSEKNRPVYKNIPFRVKNKQNLFMMKIQFNIKELKYTILSIYISVTVPNLV